MNGLPEELRRWLNPALVEDAGESIGQKLLESLPNDKLSSTDSRQIRLAFSPMREIHVLAFSDQYAEAFEKIQTAEHQGVMTEAQRADLTEEHIFVLQSYVHDLIKKSSWSEALERVTELRQLQPKSNVAETLLIEALSGWAQERIKAEDYENAVNRLKEIKSEIQNGPDELTALLADALARWGHEAIEQQQTTLAQKRFEGALKFDEATSWLAVVWRKYIFNYAADADKRGDEKPAYEFGEGGCMLCLQDELTATIYAKVCARYALQLCESVMYEAAIRVLEPALPLHYDRHEFQLEKVMSEILTDYGAVLLNSGQLTLGTATTRRAVQLDPENSVAAQIFHVLEDGHDDKTNR